MIVFAALLAVVPLAIAAPQVKGPQGYDPSMAGGIFGISFRDLQTGTTEMSGSALSIGTEGSFSLFADSDGGSGPFKAQFKADNTLPDHTVYAPKLPSAQTMPVVIFGNGGCLPYGTMYSNLLQEIASHGFLVIANGSPGGMFGPVAGMIRGQTKINDLKQSMDWVHANYITPDFVAKYGRVDPNNLAVMGQSCGGLEAYSASYNEPRVKYTILLNSGLINRTREHLLQDLKAPVAYFLGGPRDIAYANGEKDYPLLPSAVKKVKVSLDMGHLGTWNAQHAGKGGFAVVSYLKWVMKNEMEYKSLFDGTAKVLQNQGWNVTSSGW